MENNKGNPVNKFNGGKTSPREVDQLANEIHSWWGSTFVFIKKTKVKTWLGVSIMAFIGGALTAGILIISNNIQTISDAAGENAVLALSVKSETVAIGDTFDMEITLDAVSGSVVVAKAVVNYNQDDFQLTDVDTETGDFEIPRCSGVPSALCAIVEDDPGNGKLIITASKPSPGISGAIITVATLTFKALRVVAPTSPNFTLSYADGSYSDSDAILDDDKGTDILGSVNNASVAVAPEICTQWTYSEWGSCRPDGTQGRTIITSNPSGCGGGIPDILTQNCEYIPPVCADFAYSQWSECQPNGTQSRVATPAPEGCAGGEDPVLTQNCEYSHQDNAPTCTAFVYSEWSACQINNTQSRTATSSLPAGCTSGTPELSQACTYVIASNSDKNNSKNSDSDDSDSKPKEKVKPKRYISNSPENVKKGNVITEKGKNFSKRSRVNLYFSKPGGGYYPPRTVMTNSKGDFWITYRMPLSRPAGKYTWYAVDLKTGKKSATGKYTVK